MSQDAVSMGEPEDDEFDEEMEEELDWEEQPDDMEPDTTFEPEFGEQGPNTREAFEDSSEDDLLWEE